MKKILFILLIINCKFSIINCLAQGIGSRFLFGYDSNPDMTINLRANLNFTDANISVDTTDYLCKFSATAANISDSAGNLLFYTNGVTVYNKNHQIMQNGDSLSWTPDIAGFLTYGSLISQHNLIVPFYNDPTKYYLFHEYGFTFGSQSYGQQFKLQYSIVDLSYNNGLGKITNKNTTVLTDTLRNGGLTACRHANGRDWWLPIKQWRNNKFYMMLVTPNGIQNMGEQAIGDTTALVSDWAGQSMFSPNGNWYANIDGHSELNIYGFDRCTGQFTSSLHIPFADTVFASGLAFSPNSRFLYAARLLKIFQLDLDAPNILASKTQVGAYNGVIDYSYTTICYGALMPNNKIYFNTSFGTRKFHVIENPDSLGLACNFVNNAFSVNRLNNLSIPNHYNYYLGAVAGSVCDSLGLSVSSPEIAAPALRGGLEILVYPNPANDAIFVSGLDLESTSNITIQNSLGQIIYMVNVKGGIQKINTSNITNGIYMLKVTNEQGVIGTQKVTILH